MAELSQRSGVPNREPHQPSAIPDDEVVVCPSSLRSVRQDGLDREGIVRESRTSLKTENIELKIRDTVTWESYKESEELEIREG
jgi:hypothetical protein